MSIDHRKALDPGTTVAHLNRHLSVYLFACVPPRCFSTLPARTANGILRQTCTATSQPMFAGAPHVTESDGIDWGPPTTTVTSVSRSDCSEKKKSPVRLVRCCFIFLE